MVFPSSSGVMNRCKANNDARMIDDDKNIHFPIFRNFSTESCSQVVKRGAMANTPPDNYINRQKYSL